MGICQRDLYAWIMSIDSLVLNFVFSMAYYRSCNCNPLLFILINIDFIIANFYGTDQGA